MPGPTWRNIAAPDLSTSLAAISAATNNFNQGLATAKAGFNEFDAKQSERMNAAFQTALLGQQDSGKFSEALAADPTLGFDPRRLNAQSLAMAGNWTNTLLGQDRTRQSLEAGAEELTRNRWKFGEERGAAERDKVLGEKLPQLFNLALAGKENEAMAGLSAITGLRGSELSEAGKNLIGFAKSGVDITGQRQDQRFQAEDQGNKREDREYGKAADAIAEAVLSQAGPGANILALVEQASAGANPTVRAAVRARVDAALGTSLFSGMGPGGGAGVGGVSSAGGSGNDRSGIMNYEARAVGFDTVPPSVKTLGDAVAFGKQVNRAGASSSAMGIFQITQSTMEDFGQRLYGKAGWKNKEWTPQVQDELGQAIFEASNGSAQALKGRWVSLSLAEAEQVRKLPWEQAKVIIAQKESGHDFTAGGALSPQEAERMAKRGADSSSTDLDVQSWANGIGKNAPTITVAQAISKQIPGSKPKELMVIIDRMVDASRGLDKKPRLNRTQAGQIVIESMTPDTSGSVQKFLDSWGLGSDNPALSGGWRLDQGKVSTKVKAALQGDQAFIVNDNERRMAEAQSVAQAQAEYQELAQQENAIRRDIAAGRAGRASLLPQIIMQKNAAYAAWKQAEEPLLERERKSRGEPPNGTPPKKTTAKAPPAKPKAEPRSIFSLGDWFTLNSK